MSLRSVVNRVTELGPLRRVRERRYERWFAGTQVEGFPFRGVYGSFAEAMRALPRTKAAGYDVDAAADLHVTELSHMAPSDYPVAFWLDRLLHPATVVLDFGGHVGTKYRAFSRYLKYPDDLQWRVCEVPCVVARGKRLAEVDGSRHLRFTSDFGDARGADIFLGSGAIQYVEEPLWQKLATLHTLPRHVLLNKVPCGNGRSFFSVQNIHVAFVPYRIFDQQELIREMTHLGYELVDSWEVLDRPFSVPFHPEARAHHVGMYLRIRS